MRLSDLSAFTIRCNYCGFEGSVVDFVTESWLGTRLIIKLKCPQCGNEVVLREV